MKPFQLKSCKLHSFALSLKSTSWPQPRLLLKIWNCSDRKTRTSSSFSLRQSDMSTAYIKYKVIWVLPTLNTKTLEIISKATTNLSKVWWMWNSLTRVIKVCFSFLKSGLRINIYECFLVSFTVCFKHIYT